MFKTLLMALVTLTTGPLLSGVELLDSQSVRIDQQHKTFFTLNSELLKPN